MSTKAKDTYNRMKEKIIIQWSQYKSLTAKFIY